MEFRQAAEDSIAAAAWGLTWGGAEVVGQSSDEGLMGTEGSGLRIAYRRSGLNRMLCHGMASALDFSLTLRNEKNFSLLKLSTEESLLREPI